MRKIAIAIGVLALLATPVSTASSEGLVDLFNTGCVITGAHAHGCFMTAVKGPGASGPLPRGDKSGKACGYNILALFTWGDVRITTAAANGEVSEVSSVDYTAFELIPGFYGFSRFCTVVNGR